MGLFLLVQIFETIRPFIGNNICSIFAVGISYSNFLVCNVEICRYPFPAFDFRSFLYFTNTVNHKLLMFPSVSRIQIKMHLESVQKKTSCVSISRSLVVELAYLLTITIACNSNRGIYRSYFSHQFNLIGFF